MQHEECSVVSDAERTVYKKCHLVHNIDTSICSCAPTCCYVGSERVQLSLHGCQNVQLLVREYAVCLRDHLSVISH